MRGMSELQSVLKSEIARLARKEVRAETEALRKANAQYRSQISALRKRIDVLERQTKRLAAGRGAAAPVREVDEDGDGGGLRFRAAGFAQHRKRLGLSAADMGRLLGVAGATVYKWESGEAHPRKSHMAAIAQVRKMGKRAAAAQLEALS